MRVGGGGKGLVGRGRRYRSKRWRGLAEEEDGGRLVSLGAWGCSGEICAGGEKTCRSGEKIRAA